MISAYCEGFGFEGYIFRFVSILGERYTHGHVFDFYKQLLDHPGSLRILGDGLQRKSYLYPAWMTKSNLPAGNEKLRTSPSRKIKSERQAR